MGKQRQAVGERGESKTISSTSEEADKEEKADRHSPTGAARKSRRIFAANTDASRTRAAVADTRAQWKRARRWKEHCSIFGAVRGGTHERRQCACLHTLNGENLCFQCAAQ